MKILGALASGLISAFYLILIIGCLFGLTSGIIYILASIFPHANHFQQLVIIGLSVTGACGFLLGFIYSLFEV